MTRAGLLPSGGGLAPDYGVTMKPLIACRQVLGVDTYRATNEQAQLVTLAMHTYGHLLKDGTPKVHRFSFDQFADVIEANYS